MKSLRPNAYRVLGLPGEATWEEIKRVAERLRGLESWGSWSSPWDMPMLGTVRREPSDIDAAVARLADTTERLRDRLLWFHERDAESAVSYLTTASIRDALEGWSTTTLPVAKHDASVVALLAALTLDHDVEDPALWNRMLREWAEATGRDEYWLEVMRVEMDGGFETPASLGDLRDLRDSALSQPAGVLLDRARAAILDGEGQIATRALGVLREALPTALFDELCGELAAHLWGGATSTAPTRKAHHVESQPRPAPPKPVVVEPAVEPPAPWATPPASTASEQEPAEPTAEAPAVADPSEEPPVPRIDRRMMSERLARLRAMSSSTPPVDRAPEPMDRAPEPVVPTPEPVVRTPEPVVRTPEPVVPTPEPVIRAPEPVVHTTEPIPERPPVEEPRAEIPAPPPADEARIPAAVAQIPPSPPEPMVAELAPAEPTPAEPDSAKPSEPAFPPRSLPRVSRRVLAGAVLAAAIATLFLLAPWPRSFHPSGPVVATTPENPMRATLFTRMEAADDAIARLLMDRNENHTERAFLRRTIADYRTLLDDYHWRMERSLPYDPVGYSRVNGYLRDDLARYLASTADARAIADRYNALLREHSRLVAQYNELAP
jgi:hypothetical protein